MQTVFEKIIEKLEDKRKKAELLIMENPQDELDRIQTQTAEDFATAYKGAIEIVKQEAEQYNNGWIPVDERMPEEAFGCLVTVIDCNPVTLTEFENILPYVVGYDGDSWNDADGEEIPFEVIAWRKLPTPYQPKGE